jgi:radical SAM superfamily enzyme YgiQ (UPF0313 family)
MSNINVYCCDLTHTYQCVSSEFMPYPVACVAAYAKSNSEVKDQLNIQVFKFIDDLESACSKNDPHILAMSTYSWNSKISLGIAKILKDKYPDLVVVFGGHEFPHEEILQERWLKKNHHVDFYILYEGELALKNIIDGWSRLRSIDELKRVGVGNGRYLRAGILEKGESLSRVSPLDDVPSPYLMGLMDKFLNTNLWPMIQTNRGCPFACSFCVEGDSYYAKINSRSLEKVEDELKYIASRQSEHKMIYLADSNFLMYKEDVKLCEIFGRLQEEYDWPHHIGCTTGKNRPKLMAEGTSYLRPNTITLNAAVQHLDDVVLKNINRSNIKTDLLIEVAIVGKNSETMSYTETIACLPGDTVEKYKSTMQRLVETNIGWIKTHVLCLIRGSMLDSVGSRERFGFETKFRAVTKSVGCYIFLNERLSCAEVEEVVVATNTLSFEDYLECRRLQCTINTFYSDHVFEEVHSLLDQLNIPIWTWLTKIHDDLDNCLPGTKQLYKGFLDEVKEELWDTEEALDDYIEGHIDEYKSGVRGNNVTFRHKVLLFSNYMNDVIEDGFRHLICFFDDSVNKEYYLEFLSELKVIMMARKNNIFDSDSDLEFKINYPPELFLAKFRGGGELRVDKVTKLDTSVSLRVSHSSDQKDMINKYFLARNKDVVSLTTLLNRVTASAFFRQVEVVSGSKGV